MTDLRCGTCNYWIGESAIDLVRVEVVDRSAETRVATPRDLRVCKSCGGVNVFVSKDALDRSLARV